MVFTFSLSESPEDGPIGYVSADSMLQALRWKQKTWDVGGPSQNDADLEESRELQEPEKKLRHFIETLSGQLSRSTKTIRGGPTGASGCLRDIRCK